MKRFALIAASVILAASSTLFAEVKVVVDRNEGKDATPEFKFKQVPAPARINAATGAKFALADGQRDENGATLKALQDGKLPTSEDEPASAFFFAPSTPGGRIVIDLGSAINVKQVNTYSWHSDARAPQVYTLYGNDGDKFDAKPGKDVDPAKAGWKLIAKVDTRPKAGEPGGQYGVSISDSDSALGKFKSLLLVVSRTDDKDDFSNTFYSEVVVIDADAKAVASAATEPAKPVVNLAKLKVNLTRANGELKAILPDPEELLDAAKRKDLAPKLTPALKNLVTLLTQMQEAEPKSANMVAGDILRYQSYLSLLGDEDGSKALVQFAADEDDVTAIRGKVAQLQVRWWSAASDAKAQQAVLADIQKLATANAASGSLVGALMAMKDFGAANAANADKVEEIVANTMTGGDAPDIKLARNGRLKQEATMNKPIEFAGPTVEGKDFSTTSLKGKVILIDFWATWCGPCVKELPRVKALYTKYHDQGLEVVGISCDSEGAKLADYVKKNDMPWPQMWDKKAQVNDRDDNWHPLAKSWGVLAIPQMFLIDRNGNLRTVEARENMEEMIPKLIAEKAGGQLPKP